MEERRSRSERKTEKIMNEQNEQRLIQCILDAGELILKSGGEISRVEDTMIRMFRAYGFLRADVFTITSSIVVTVSTKEGKILTQTRRVSGYDMNLERVHLMNQLARDVCAEPLELEELERRMEAVRTSKELSPAQMVWVYGAVAAVFSVFFGGGILEALLGGITGMGLCLLLQLLEQPITNAIVRYALGAALGGLFLGLVKKCGVNYLIEPALMGNIMLLIPGIPFTNAIRDMLNGDTMSGMLRMCESLLRTIAVAAGFVGVLTMLGGLM